MRYTNIEVKGMFNRLAKHMLKPLEGTYTALELDYMACYGGYVIEWHDENGGINHPFGSRRRNAKEMYVSMLMATQVLEEIQYQQSQKKKAAT